MSINKVLIIDDEKGFTSMLQLNLEAVKGYNVRVENEPNKALATVLQFKPDIILLDVIMPNKGGPDVADEIRNHNDLQDIPIIFLTATITGADFEEEKKAINGRPFVAKPSNLDHLISSIEKYAASA